MGTNTRIGSIPGIPIRGVIQSFDIQRKVAMVKLPLASSPTLQPIKLPVGWMGARGEVSCGYPAKGTNIFVVMGQGNEWIFVSYDQPDSTSLYDSDGIRRISTTKFRPGRWLTLVQNDVGLIVDPQDGVVQGDSTSFTQADSMLDIWSSRFANEMHFTEAHREVTGTVLRDIDSDSTRNVTGSSLTDHTYNNSLTPIGLDPSTFPSVSAVANRNPALTESRKMYYEFIDSFGYTYDEAEERIYAGQDLSQPLPFQRKRSRTDTMSLSLDQPNYLAEVIVGTVVDIYGNILDINRSILPSGIVDSLSFRKSSDDQNVAFTNLLTQLRKSIAYHFELNARKPGLDLPNYSDVSDYARNRSRFFFDIDKEGQFKWNVPASSETGNVPVLVRHENFSNLKGFIDKTDRGQLLYNVTNNTDLQLEPHGKGAVSLVSTEDTLKNFAAPVNRLDGSVIKLGTGFHDISNVLFLHKVDKPYSSSGNAGYENSLINFVSPVTDVVSSKLIVSGAGANAGGRSGTISLDGMLSVSIGANTADRQSLWLDCAGGMVAAVGRDKFNRSLAATLDGDILMQVGGPTIVDDSRFPSVTFNNEARDGTIDIRVWNSGSFHTIRIDPQGIKIHTPQNIDIVSEGSMRFKSVNSNIYFDAESVYFYTTDPATGRLVLRATEGAAGRTV
jgi:hypothetical protein